MSPSHEIFAKGFMHIFKIQNMDIENILLTGSYALIPSLQVCLLYRLLHGGRDVEGWSTLNLGGSCNHKLKRVDPMS